MITSAVTVAFDGIDPREVEVQCILSSGLPAFNIVGLPDKAVSEARERVRAALHSMNIAFPAKRITINLSPANLPKIGSHFDLPIALALLAAIDIVPQDQLSNAIAVGELSLDGRLIPVNGALPAAMAAAETGRSLICPAECGPEAAFIGTTPVFAPRTLLETTKHLSGHAPLSAARPSEMAKARNPKDFSDVKGQERAKRALEIAATGRHHIVFVGPPGSGKSMLAARIPSILPPLSAREALETSIIRSLSGDIAATGISRERPFCAPHHTASMAAIAGGGRRAQPGEVSLAHNGVLFLDELPEFSRSVLDTLRQPIETGEIHVARADSHVKYPSRFMLVAAANPCRCGHLVDPEMACSRAPKCGQDYMGKVSGPLMDRFDLRIDVPPVSLNDLSIPQNGETSEVIRKRVAAARAIQDARYAQLDHIYTNSDIEGALLEKVATPAPDAQALLNQIAPKFRLTARGYHRVLRVARTIADLDQQEVIQRHHISEALSYRTGG